MSAILLTGVAVQALNVLSGPMVARMVGPAGRGDIAVVWIFSILGGTLGTTSLSIAISRTVARTGGAARDVLGTGPRLWFAWALVPGAGAAGGAYLTLAGSSDRFALALVTAAIAVAGCWLNVVVGMLQGEHAVPRINQIRLGLTGLYVALVVVLFVTDVTDRPVVVQLAYLAASLMAVLAGWWSLMPRTRIVGTVPAAEVHARARRAYFTAIGPLTLGLDYVVISVVLTSSDLGLYAVAGSVSTLPVMVLSSLGSTLVAKMSALGPDHWLPLMRRWVAIALVADVALAVAMEAIIDPVIRIFFGAAFVPAIPVARIMIVAIAVLAFRSVLAGVAQAQDRGGRSSVTDVASTVLMVLGVAVGAHAAGIEGAAVGFLGAAVAGCLAICLIIRWRPVATTSTDLRVEEVLGRHEGE